MLMVVTEAMCMQSAEKRSEMLFRYFVIYLFIDIIFIFFLFLFSVLFSFFELNVRPKHEGDEFAGIIAARTGNMVGHLQDIPNEPAHFFGEKV
jgi:hypothetical protein